MSRAVAHALGTTWADAGLTVVVALAVYVTIIALSRVFGQRQFSRSSTYDLAFVFALGSLIGRVILVRTSLATAVIGLVTMFVLHTATGALHHRVPAVHRLIQNAPRLVVADGELVDEQLAQGHLSADEVYQELRLSGHGSLDGIRAVVLERNGSLSVIPDGARVDDDVFHEVLGRERLGGVSGTTHAR